MNASRPLSIALLTAALAVAVPNARADQAAKDSNPLVVVELFTSQGCSSCPPADAFLGELTKDPAILALGFHVDYWNYIGWTDPYAAKAFTDRQRDYEHRLGFHYVYTPQMVIDGTEEGVGSDRGKMGPLLSAALRAERPRPVLTLLRLADGRLHIHVGAGKAGEPATIWLVGYDHVHQTTVERGENAGRALDDYQVVRSLQAVGSWSGAPFDLDLATDAAAGDGAAILLQTDKTGPIITAATLTGPSS